MAIISVSCDDFLDAKPNKDIVTPNTGQAIRALLDNAESINSLPSISVLCSDEFITTDAGLGIYSNQWLRELYKWNSTPFAPEEFVADWASPYQTIFFWLFCLILNTWILSKGLSGGVEKVAKIASKS